MTLSGKADTAWLPSETIHQPLAGVVRQHVHKESVRNTAKPMRVVSNDQPEAREGQAGTLGGGEVRSTADAG